MASALERLALDGPAGGNPAGISAKDYVFQHQELIFMALAGGAKYADIQKALKSEGVTVSYQYLKELILRLKKRQTGYRPTRTKAAMKRLKNERKAASDKALSVKPAPPPPEPVQQPAAPETGGVSLDDLRARFSSGGLSATVKKSAL